ncbi:MAG: helix-turn-helix domain-containing protein [Promethearchaeota archaeon]
MKRTYKYRLYPTMQQLKTSNRCPHSFL